MEDCVTFLLLFLTTTWIILSLISNSRARKSADLPPGPFRFPIVGSIFRLGSKPHTSIAQLSKKYGPLMSLKLGTTTAVVVSSPEIARVVLQTYDLPFSSRKVPAAAEAFHHHEFSMVWLPVDNQWRKLRKICRENMFSVAKLDASQGLRKEKLQKLYGYLKNCSETGRVVDVGEAAFTTSLNLMSATLFSEEIAQFNSDSSEEMKEVIWGVMKCVGAPNLADYFPILKSVDPRGILRESKVWFGKLFEMFDRIIDQRLKSEFRKNDMLDALLRLHRREDPLLSRTDINHLLMDLFIAGTDTTSSTVEWALTELLCNPDKMTRLRDEISNLVGENGEIQESMISQLPYLQAVVKEAFRLHPAVPVLSRKAISNVQINGYNIPANTQILVNVWASGRDSNVWRDANLFIPERFLGGGDNNRIDFRGANFELIPFGSGRRICPGLPLAYLMVHLMVIALVHKFIWKLEGSMKAEDMDMDEKFGVTLQKAKPLRAIPMNL